MIEKGRLTVIEKIKGISIKGRCFASDTPLQFYPNSNDRISIVYGKNGSGKSTISDGFSCISVGSFPADLSAFLFDQSNTAIPLSDGSKIFVFNERYIDENVKIDADGLGTIILLGGQVDLQSEIDRYTGLERTARLACDAAQTSLEQFNQGNNPVSPNYHLARIKKILQSGWAVGDATIKGNKINSKVTEGIINEICELSVSETVPQLQKQFDETKSLLEKVSDTSASYPSPICPISIASNFESELCDLLAKIIEKPVLTERETLILAAIKGGKQSFVEAAQKDFNDVATSICPYCYRPIDEEYKHGLIESINRVLNKEVDAHKAELRAVSFPVLTEDYRSFTDLDPRLVERIMEQRSVCVDLLSKYKSAIQEKENNIYTPFYTSPLGLESSIAKLNALLMELEAKRQEFTDAVKKRKSLVQSLISLNKKIAHLQVEQAYRDYQKQVRAKKAAESNLQAKQKSHSEISAHLKSLELEKANVGLAINNINNALDYVFFTHERLSIELKDDRYYLKSNGKDVKPKNVSLGERNIIALCYFFTQILSNQEVEKLYQDEELVVIDDPVSSFDFENKIGIISFIRYQVNRIIRGNSNSKVLILSHDLATIFDLNKAMEEICQSTKGIAKIVATTYYPAELCDGGLRRFVKRRSEYGELLGKIYHYANGENSDDKLIIGNTMRRALEAFSTFTYRKSIEDVLYNQGILEELGEHSVYFENLMCRLVLHGESHFEEQVYNLHDDANFYEFISDVEKQRTAKDILCFMYLLNNRHIEAYLKDIAGAIDNIKTWSRKIPNNASFEIKESSKQREIPLFDLPLSAGIGLEMFDGSVPFEKFRTTVKDCDFALRVSGDSMEPEISDSSIVLIKKCDSIAEGKVGAFYLNGAVYCKKLSYENSKAFLCSNNPKYQPIEIHDHDALTTYGQVVKVISSK